MKKILKIAVFVFIGILAIVLVFSVFYQVTLEKYIAKQKQKYSILNGEKRESYTPFLYYHFKRKILNVENNNHKMIGYLYENCENQSIIRNNYYDEYIVECYFSELEIQPPPSSLPND